MSDHKHQPITNSFLQTISCEGVIAAIGLSFVFYCVRNIVISFDNQLTWRDFKDVYADRLNQHLFACGVCVIFMIFLVGLTSSKALRFKDPKIRKRIRMIFVSLFGIILVDVLILLLCDTCFVIYVL